MHPLVVIEEIDIESVAVLEPENDSPIAADSHRPETGQAASERMQPVGRKVERPGRFGGIQGGENAPHLAAQGGSDPARIIVFVQPPEAPVAEASDHTRLYSDKCRLSIPWVGSGARRKSGVVADASGRGPKSAPGVCSLVSGAGAVLLPPARWL